MLRVGRSGYLGISNNYATEKCLKRAVPMHFTRLLLLHFWSFGNDKASRTLKSGWRVTPVVADIISYATQFLTSLWIPPSAGSGHCHLFHRALRR